LQITVGTRDVGIALFKAWALVMGWRRERTEAVRMIQIIAIRAKMCVSFTGNDHFVVIGVISRDAKSSSKYS